MNQQEILEKIYDVGRWDSWVGGCNPPASTTESIGTLRYQGVRLRYTIYYNSWDNPKRTLVIQGVINDGFSEVNGNDPLSLPFNIDRSDLVKIVKKKFLGHGVRILDK